jgi:hypothetical protein
MSKSNVFENDWMKLIFNGIAIPNLADNAASSPATNLFLSLHTADPGEAGTQTTSEVAYTGYARAAVPRTSLGWSVVENAASLTSNVDFNACTGGTAVVTHFAVGLASTGAGKILYKGTVNPTISIANGVTPRLTTGTIISED